jgi:hypothetical protein
LSQRPSFRKTGLHGVGACPNLSFFVFLANVMLILEQDNFEATTSTFWSTLAPFDLSILVYVLVTLTEVVPDSE